MSQTAVVLVLNLLLGSATNHIDVVIAWNVAALSAVRAEKTQPPVAARALAILHVSIYDAINGVERSFEPYLASESVPQRASKEAAATVAAHDVLVKLFPSMSWDFDRLNSQILMRVPEGPEKARGMTWGERVARDILSARAADGAEAQVVLPPASGGPGKWVPTPPAFTAYVLPQWGFVRPFAMPTSSFFRPAGPPTLNSERWARDYDEVKAYGAATGSLRTLEQNDIAFFWSDGPGTETPPGHWNTIARTMANQHRNTLEANSRLFALLNIAMADAAICAWDAKYTYRFWRPVTAMRSGDPYADETAAGVTAWSSFIPTPSFPDYVSGHSVFSGAAATILASFFGTDRMAFDSTSDALPGVTRHFLTFSSAAAEAALSRLYGGIHFRSANEDGLKAGIAIARWTLDHYLRPSQDDTVDRKRPSATRQEKR
jgi:hypothetical protein